MLTCNCLCLYTNIQAGSITILGATGGCVFTLDKGSGAMALKAKVDRIDLQQMLRAAGVSVNLCKWGLLTCQL